MRFLNFRSQAHFCQLWPHYLLPYLSPFWPYYATGHVFGFYFSLAAIRTSTRAGIFALAALFRDLQEFLAFDAKFITRAMLLTFVEDASALRAFKLAVEKKIETFLKWLRAGWIFLPLVDAADIQAARSYPLELLLQDEGLYASKVYSDVVSSLADQELIAEAYKTSSQAYHCFIIDFCWSTDFAFEGIVCPQRLPQSRLDALSLRLFFWRTSFQPALMWAGIIWDLILPSHSPNPLRWSTERAAVIYHPAFSLQLARLGLIQLDGVFSLLALCSLEGTSAVNYIKAKLAYFESTLLYCTAGLKRFDFFSGDVGARLWGDIATFKPFVDAGYGKFFFGWSLVCRLLWVLIILA